MPPEYEMRPAEPQDHKAILSLVYAVVQAGDALPWEDDVSHEELARYWLPAPSRGVETFVIPAPRAGIAGVFVLYPTNGGRVGHVAQGSFVVAEEARGHGLGQTLCAQALLQARAKGYKSMRLDTVVATNTAALRVCLACGFKTMCTLPQSFKHSAKGFVDTLIMFRTLDDVEADMGPSLLKLVRGTPTPQSALVQSPPSPRCKRSPTSSDMTPLQINEAFASQLENVESLADLRALEPAKTRQYGDWMIWMVHRAWLDDPELIELNFNNMNMPDGHVEQRIAPKLMEAIGWNTHMQVLSLSNSNVQKAQGFQLAESLPKNTTLRVVNLEGNVLDSAAVRQLALAIRENVQCSITELRMSHQKQMGGSFGRPTEEAVGLMMEGNHSIVKLGFECHDAHWRNLIDRALLRNMDAERRKQGAGPEALPPASQEMTLGQLLLEIAPAAHASKVFTESSSSHELYRSYVAQSRKLPTASQLLNCAKNSGVVLAYSAAAPLVKECRAWMLGAAIATEVVVTDAFGVPKPGVMERWAECNDSWSIELTAHEDGKRYTFRSSREPAFAVSEAWANWLEQP